MPPESDQSHLAVSLQAEVAALTQQVNMLRARADDPEILVHPVPVYTPPIADVAGAVALPFYYAGVDPASAPANDAALFNVGWVKIVGASAQVLKASPNAEDGGSTDADAADDPTKTDSIGGLANGANFIVAHLQRAAAPEDSTLELLRYATKGAVPADTNDDYYYLLAQLRLSTDGEGNVSQLLVRQYRAGIIDWNATPKALIYCDGDTDAQHTYEMPAYEAPS